MSGYWRDMKKNEPHSAEVRYTPRDREPTTIASFLLQPSYQSKQDCVRIRQAPCPLWED